MIILAIETSCDETSVAVVEDGRILHSLVTNTQIDTHKAFGGVVPEIAARSHIEVMIPVVDQALESAFGYDEDTSVYWSKIDAIAVTQGPGLVGSLLVGVSTARTLAQVFGKPLIAVHHILGHVYANWITRKGAKTNTVDDSNNDEVYVNTLALPDKTPDFPALALIVSGGHTQLMYGQGHDDWRVIGRTTDDAVGEAFDKVAKILGLPYPGGVSVSKIAKIGNPKAYALPTPQVSSIDQGILSLREELKLFHGDKVAISAKQHYGQYSYNFSFSGLKTAFLRAVQKECGKTYDFPSFKLSELLNDTQKADFAASFESVSIKYLTSKTVAAYKELQPKSVIIGGGVAASSALRSSLKKALPLGIQYAPMDLCTDNAAMIGARAYYQIRQTGAFSDPLTLQVKPSWSL